MNHKFNNNIIEIFPKAYIIEFEISLDSKEVVQQLDLLQTELNNHPYIAGIEPDTSTNDSTTPKNTSWTPLVELLHKEEFSSLKNKIWHCVEEYNKRFNVCTKGIEITNSWFNVMTKGTTSKFHIHEGSLLSGTYYPLLPEGSANLSFINPEKEIKMVSLKEGFLYVFPSSLEHGVVDINNCDKRIVISFNTTDVNTVKYHKEFEKINQHSTNEIMDDELEKFITADSSKNITEFMLAALKLNQK